MEYFIESQLIASNGRAVTKPSFGGSGPCGAPMLFIRKLSLSNQAGHVIHSAFGFPIYAISPNTVKSLLFHRCVRLPGTRLHLILDETRRPRPRPENPTSPRAFADR